MNNHRNDHPKNKPEPPSQSKNTIHQQPTGKKCEQKIDNRNIKNSDGMSSGVWHAKRVFVFAKQHFKNRKIIIMEENEFIFNEETSPEDERDWVAESIYPSDLKVPKTLDLRQRMPSVRNQGSRGTCAAHTASMIKAYQENVDIGINEHMSPEFIYFFREKKPDSGMYGRNVMKILKEKGTVPEYRFPYQSSDPEEIPSEILVQAQNFRIKSYALVKTIEGVKKALFVNGPCYVSFPVYKNRPEFWRAEKGEKRSGGHAVTLVGYNKEGFIVRNSWGSRWNGDGHVIYPYKDWGMHREIWTLIDEKSDQIKTPTRLEKILMKLCK